MISQFLSVLLTEIAEDISFLGYQSIKEIQYGKIIRKFIQHIT